MNTQSWYNFRSLAEALRWGREYKHIYHMRFVGGTSGWSVRVYYWPRKQVQ